MTWKLTTSYVTLRHLQSPIVTLAVGSLDEPTTITGHQSLLSKSPFFKSYFASATSPYTVHLPDESLDAVGCFIQYLYTGEYFPKLIKRKDDDVLENDPAHSIKDEEGDHLLKHARVYTLADKFGMKELKSLAHKKIHKISSTAKGEIVYARFVYANTPREDKTIRAPVSAFWASQGKSLPHSFPPIQDLGSPSCDYLAICWIRTNV